MHTNSPRKIYCVHGKPSSGCCKVLEGQVIEIKGEEIDLTSHTKENQDATNLSKQIIKYFSINFELN